VIRRIWLVLWDARLAAFALGIVALAIAGCFLFPDDSTVRRTGTALEVLGLLTAAYGLVHRWRRFRRPTPLHWLRRLVGAFREPRHAVVNVPLGSLSATGSLGTLKASGSFSPTLEDRVASLEAKLDQLRSDSDTKLQEVKTSISELRQLLDQEATRRERAPTEIESQIADVSAGGVEVEIVGLAWLFVGMMLANMPAEVLGAVKWIQSFA
jgi:hypothetical protein